jgi:hypothetical protein
MLRAVKDRMQFRHTCLYFVLLLCSILSLSIHQTVLFTSFTSAILGLIIFSVICRCRDDGAYFQRRMNCAAIGASILPPFKIPKIGAKHSES